MSSSDCADLPSRLALARRQLLTNDTEEGLDQCRRILADFPDDPLALHLCAGFHYRQGRPCAALHLLIESARALSADAHPRDVQDGIHADLTNVLMTALAGVDLRWGALQADAYRRSRARAWRDRERSASRVSVILRCRDPSDVLRSFESVLYQTMRPLEVLVVGSSLHASRRRLRRGRFPRVPVDVRFIQGTGEGPGLNAALARSRGDWVVVLDAPHELAPEHLEVLIGALASDGSDWGFAACRWPEGGASEHAVEHLSRAREVQSILPEADSVGFALIDRSFAPVGAGAVAFARDLVDQAGGFRDAGGHELWDLCLRAVWLAEPIFVARQTYLHDWTDRAMPAPTRDARESADSGYRRMWREYYERACRDDAAPPNAFAPSRVAWRLHFFRRALYAGHLFAIDVATLEHIAADLSARTDEGVHAPLRPGMNLVGAALAEFGFGEIVRTLARAGESVRIPFVVKDVGSFSIYPSNRTLARHLVDRIEHDVSILCLPPHKMEALLPAARATRRGGGSVVGCWYWELEHVPRPWKQAFSEVDEVWCGTEFIAQAMRAATEKPVVKIPPAIAVDLASPFRRDDFGIPAHTFAFLFTFDFYSCVRRKNPEAVVAAFMAAFPRGRTDVSLVLKSSHGQSYPDQLERLRELVTRDPRIVCIDSLFSRARSYGLLNVVDAYVSLHRAEGLGLGLAESMYLGKPAVATAYSGNLEFMREGNSALVDFRMVPVAPGDYVYDDPRFIWAEPDIDSAARQLRRLADDAAWRSKIARAGRHTVRTELCEERVAKLIDARIRMLSPGLSDARAEAV